MTSAIAPKDLPNHLYDGSFDPTPDKATKEFVDIHRANETQNGTEAPKWLQSKESVLEEVKSRRQRSEYNPKARAELSFKSKDGTYDIKALRYRPKDMNLDSKQKNEYGVFLHFHGGGGVLDAAPYMPKLLQRVADEVGVDVISVLYRLAPKNSYPKGAQDCYDVAKFLIDNPNIYGKLALIGGESAGAYLSVVTYFRLLNDPSISGKLESIKGLISMFGYFDLNKDGYLGNESNASDTSGDEVTLNKVREFVRYYKGDAPDSPELSPLHSDLLRPGAGGLCSALFMSGDYDTLGDLSKEMALKWDGAAKGKAWLVRLRGGWHGCVCHDPNDSHVDKKDHAPIIKYSQDRLIEFCKSFTA